MSGLFGGKGANIVTSAPIISSLRLQTSAYGRPIQWGWGKARVSVNLIWYGDFTAIPHTTTTTTGGKGGGGKTTQTNITYTYTAAVLLAIGRGEIAGTPTVWRGKRRTTLAAEGLTLFTGSASQSPFSYLTTNHPSEALSYRRIAYAAHAALDLGDSAQVENFNFEVAWPLQRGSAGQAGKTFTTGSFSTDTLSSPSHGFSHNRRVDISSSGTLPAPLTPGTYYAISPTANTFKLSATQNGAPITITNAGTGTHTASFSFWVFGEDNHQEQEDRNFTAALSTDQFSSTAHGYALNTIIRVSSGGTLPPGLTAGVDYYIVAPAANTFKLSIAPNGAPVVVTSAGSGTHTVIRFIADADVDDVFQELLTNPDLGVGFAAGRIGSLTQFANYCIANSIFISPVLTDQRTVAEWVEELAVIGNAEIVFSEDKIKVVPYSDQAATGNGVTYTPDATPLFEFNDDDFQRDGDRDPVELMEEDSSDAYNLVMVKFWNRELDYNEDVVEAKDDANIALFGERPMEQPVDLRPIVDKNVAQVVAQLILQHQLYFRAGYRFSLGPGKSDLLEPMDVITITDSRLGLTQHPVRVREIEERDGEEGGFTLTVREFPTGPAAGVLYPSQAGTGFNVNFNASPGDPNTPIIVDAPGVLTPTGFEVWVAVSGLSPNWGGCQVWVATDSGGPFEQTGTIFGASRHGTLSAIFPSGSDPDTTNDCRVDLTVSRGSLTGGTQADADAENTLCLVEGELIAFQAATLTAQYKYDLETYLRRGLHGTVISEHQLGGTFVRLDQAIGRIEYDPSMIGKTIYIKLPGFNVFGAAQQTLDEVEAYAYVIQGSISRPVNVTGFSVSQNGAVAVFQWNLATLDQHWIKGHEIRYLPRLDHAPTEIDWQSATPLTRVTRGTQITTAKLPPGDWTTFIKARDYSERESRIAATFDIDMLSTFDLINQRAEDPDWLGTKTNFLKHWTGVLVPDSTKTAAQHTREELFEQFVPYPQAICSYEAPEQDLGVDGTVRVWAEVDSFLGRGAAGIADPQLQIDYRLEAGSYDGFEDWTIGNVEARRIKSKIVVDTSVGKAVLRKFRPTADAEERDEVRTGIAIGGSGSGVTFLQPFHLTPSLSFENDGATPLIPTYTGLTAAGFTGHLYNTSGSEVGGTGKYRARGV